MTYRLLDHTADLGIEVQAAAREGLFEEALRAMTDCVTEVARVTASERRRLTAAAPALDLLMVEWLGEVLYRFEAEDLLLARAEVTIEPAAAGFALSADAWGEVFDPLRHPLKVPIKGVTYHGLEVVETERGWRARVIFDV